MSLREIRYHVSFYSFTRRKMIRICDIERWIVDCNKSKALFQSEKISKEAHSSGKKRKKKKLWDIFATPHDSFFVFGDHCFIPTVLWVNFLLFFSFLNILCVLKFVWLFVKNHTSYSSFIMFVLTCLANHLPWLISLSCFCKKPKSWGQLHFSLNSMMMHYFFVVFFFFNKTLSCRLYSKFWHLAFVSSTCAQSMYIWNWYVNLKKCPPCMWYHYCFLTECL